MEGGLLYLELEERVPMEAGAEALASARSALLVPLELAEDNMQAMAEEALPLLVEQEGGEERVLVVLPLLGRVAH